MIRQAAARDADGASLNCHLPHKAVSKDSAGIPACVGVRAVGTAAVEDDAGDTGDEDDDFQVARPHRLEGELRGLLVALAVAPGIPAAAEQGSQNQNGRLRSQRLIALTPFKIAIPCLP